MASEKCYEMDKSKTQAIIKVLPRERELDSLHQDT